jgi:nucleotide-binding universal stress UspA family protein
MPGPDFAASFSVAIVINHAEGTSATAATPKTSGFRNGMAYSRMQRPGSVRVAKGGAAVMTIVVGVDGSDDAHRVLRFAVDEAKLRAVPLRLISTWEGPVENWGELPPEESPYRPRQRAEETVAEAAQIAERLAPNVQCECLALEGEGGAVLLEHSSDATLVVVGRHGHGFAGKLLGSVADAVLGSVSMRVVREARCPVVVVPDASPPE